MYVILEDSHTKGIIDIKEWIQSKKETISVLRSEPGRRIRDKTIITSRIETNGASATTARNPR